MDNNTELERIDAALRKLPESSQGETAAESQGCKHMHEWILVFQYKG